MRGAEANHLLVMIDGVPANAVGDGEYNFADFAMEDIERIELLRGPQSGLYGANAHSGVLTIVTKSGRGLARPEFSARVEGGTQGSAEGAMSARGAAGPVYGAITANYATTDGFNIARNGSERTTAHGVHCHRQGRHRLHAELQRRGLRAPHPAQRRHRSAGPELPQPGLVVDAPDIHAIRRNACARRRHAEAVR